jgi:biopolymer transport protein ExbD
VKRGRLPPAVEQLLLLFPAFLAWSLFLGFGKDALDLIVLSGTAALFCGLRLVRLPGARGTRILAGALCASALLGPLAVIVSTFPVSRWPWFIIELPPLGPPLALPVAPSADEDMADDNEKRYVINLEPGGVITFKDRRYSLNEIRDILNLLKRAYGKFRTFETDETKSRWSALYLLIRVDKDTPWQHLSWLLHAVEAERLYKVQYGVFPAAPRRYGAKEAALLDAGRSAQPRTRRELQEWQFKVVCFLRTPWSKGVPNRPPVAIGIEPGELDWVEWGPRLVRAPRAAIYRLGKRTTTDLRELGRWIDEAVVQHRRKYDGLIPIGRIRAAPTVPFKFVIAALSKLNEARVDAVDLQDRSEPPAAVREQLSLPHPGER